jgi:hypothetical protein
LEGILVDKKWLLLKTVIRKVNNMVNCFAISKTKVLKSDNIHNDKGNLF